MRINRYATLAVLSLALVLGPGCTTNPGVRWYAPTTWFSHAPASRVDAANAEVEHNKDVARKQAQMQAHKAQIALEDAPPSRPVAIAQAANDDTVALLDQTEGLPDLGAIRTLKDRVKALESDNMAIREAAEVKDKAETTKIIEISSKLVRSEARADAATDKLRVAFDRENTLANDLRAQHALLWIVGSAAVLCACGWLYVRFFLGGFPSAVGGLLARLETKNPTAASDARSILDDLFHHKPSVQAAIAAAYAKNRP